MIKISMDSPCLTMSCLETLSTDELLGLAEKFGIDMPENLERIFIIEELMELQKEPHPAQNGREENVDFLPFPENYKKTSIGILIRDPLWAFAFWDINENDRKNLENTADFEGFFLMIVPLGSLGGHADDKGSSLPPDASFFVEVDKNDSARYLGFPPEGGRSFQVELCASCKGKKSALALTAPFTMPRLIEPVSAAEKMKTDAANNKQGEHNPLVQLSGVDRFILTRSKDRISRTYDSRLSDPGAGE
jgi:hypothetical protein